MPSRAIIHNAAMMHVQGGERTTVVGAHSYGGTSLIWNSTPLGPYSSNMSKALWRPCGGLQFLMSEVPLQTRLEILALHS